MIQVTKDLVLNADELCYIVGRPCKTRGKGLELRNRTYHTTAAQAVQSAVLRTMRQDVADGSITMFRQFIEEQARLQAELEALIVPLEPGQARQQTTREA